MFEIDRERSLYLKGIAISMVLIGHGCAWLTKCQYTLFTWAGAIGVAVFLFVSGYGLNEVYTKNQSIELKSWWLKRICKVMIPYWIMMLFESVIIYIFMGQSISRKEWLLSFVGYVDYDSLNVIDSTMWYITFLLVWYILFSLIWSLKIRNLYKVILILLISGIGYMLDIALVFDWKINYFTFPLGVVVSTIKNKISKRIDKYVFLISAICLVGITQVYWSGKVSSVIQCSVYACSGLFVCLMLSKYIKKDTIIEKMFKYLGNASYEIYLFEGFVIQKLLFAFATELSWLNVTYFAFFSILFGVTFHYMNVDVNQFLKVHRTNLKYKGNKDYC